MLAGDDNGVEHIPVWPFAEFAAPCAAGDWKGTRPESINLDDRMSKWLHGMMSDGRLVAVFYTPNSKGVVVTPDVLKEHLAEELEQYG